MEDVTPTGAQSAAKGQLHPSFLVGAPPLMDHTRPFQCPKGEKVKEVWDKTLARIDAIETSKWTIADKVDHFKEKVL